LAGRLSQLSIRVWVSPAGKITRVELATSTGTSSIDLALQEIIKAMSAFGDPPPQSILDSLPVEMTVKVHRT
jgi:TonB family protein